MSLTSPKANLLKSIIERLKEKAPSLKYISRDVKQLEAYQIRPAVSWPCCLITIDRATYSDVQGEQTQIAQGTVTLRIGLVQYSDSNNVMADNVLENSLKYYETEQEVFEALHGWAPAGFNKLLRTTDGPETRDDDILVVVVEFSLGYTDMSTKKQKITIPRPEPVIS